MDKSTKFASTEAKKGENTQNVVDRRKCADDVGHIGNRSSILSHNMCYRDCGDSSVCGPGLCGVTGVRPAHSSNNSCVMNVYGEGKCHCIQRDELL